MFELKQNIMNSHGALNLFLPKHFPHMYENTSKVITTNINRLKLRKLTLLKSMIIKNKKEARR